MPVAVETVETNLKTLGLSPEDLDEEKVRVAYKKLALQWHPDRHNADPEEANQKFIEVNEAYKALVEECKKKRKRKAPKEKETSSRRPFWASSTPSTASKESTSTSSSKDSFTTSSSRASSSTTATTSSRTSCHSESSSRTTTTAKAESSTRVSSTAKTEPRRERSLRKSAQSPTKPSRSRDHPSTPQPAHRSPKVSYHTHDSDDDSPDEGSIHKHKHRHPSSRAKPRALGEDDYEFIDLGTPLKPLRSPRPARSPSSASASKDWTFPLPVTLEDLAFGAKHRYRITRTLSPAHSPSGAKTQTVQIDVRVAPGWRPGTRVRVAGVGNQRGDGSFQDIVFVVEDAPHPRFRRGPGGDLVLPVQVPWADAPRRRRYPCAGTEASDETDEDACGGGEEEVYVRGLDGEEFAVAIPRSLVEAADGTRICGAGMPVREDGEVVGKGDLVIRWEFVFPESDKLQTSRWQSLKNAIHLKLPV